MDHFRKKHLSGKTPNGFSQSMILRGGGSMFHAGHWFPAADVYETASALIVCIDVSGMEPDTLAVTVEESRVTVSGRRGYEPQDRVANIHQLEIERGVFERTIHLPKNVDVSGAVSESRNGFLQITLPLRRHKGKIKIAVK